MMKTVFKLGYIFLIILFVFSVCNNVYAQKKKKKSPHAISGDRYFEVFEYVKAAEEFKIAYEADPTDYYALFMLAESYRNYFNYFEAEKYYKIATQKAIQEYPLSRYWHGVMLKDNGDYIDAKDEFLLFKKEYKATDLKAELYKQKAVEEAEGCTMALEELKKPQRNYEFKSLPTPVNSENNEYAPAIMHNDSSLVFSSTRLESKGKGESGTGGNVDDIFRFEQGAGHQWTTPDDPDGFNVVNTLFGEGAGSFTGDKSKFYFTRCGEKVKVGDYIERTCAVYVTHLKDGKWQKPVRLNENVNMKGQWNAQPAISPDGKVLFFVSQRPGGIGMHDIWYSTSTGSENWSKAINMGDKVNTIFSEISPRYYGKEKTLFFSSNGREGFGGFDVYFVHEGNLDTVRNISFPFNSNRDDQYFVLGEKRGYITSNREGGIGNYDIYSFNIDSKEALIAYINNDTLKGDSINSITVEGTLTHHDTKLPASNVGVILSDDDDNKLKTSSTNEKGDFRFDNLSTDKNYKVLLKEEDARITKQVKYQVEKVEVKGSERVASKTVFDNIYFDFNKHDLRQESKGILDKLIELYNKHPEIQIEMSANTDSYGTDEYNIHLSSSRGKSAMDYLLLKGVDKSAIVVNAEGEGHPVAKNNSDIGRQLNRRVEFFIVGGPGYTANKSSATIDPKSRALYYVAKQYNMTVEDLEAYMKFEKTATSSDLKHNKGIDYYIVQPKNTLYSIARLYGMTLAELRELNGINDTYQGIAIGQKIKVKTLGAAPDGYHLVKPGETLYSISQENGLTVEELVNLNHFEGYILRKRMIMKIK